jgi:hypothetical protein
MFNVKGIAAAKGYGQSSKDFYYASLGDDVANSLLMHRNYACTCDNCLERKHSECSLTEVLQKYPRNVFIPPLVELPPVETRGGSSFEEFCGRTMAGQNVIVRIHSSQKDQYPENEYFVGKLLEKPYQLRKGGIFQGNRFNAGFWVAQIAWYEWVKEDCRGDHYYRLLKQSQTLQCNNFVRNLSREIKLTRESRASGLYKLGQKLHDYIVVYGQLSC